MKTLVRIAVILAAVAVILGLSLASAIREQRRLSDEFTATNREQLHTSVQVLSARLDALDQDTRLLIDLVERSRNSPGLDQATEQRIWASAFKALAVVVPQYRIIALCRADGALDVLEVDPTETTPTVEALLPASRRLAVEISATGVKSLAKPAARYGDRSFLLYGTPVRGGGAIVVASDAAIFLGAVAWTPLPIARLFVTDPASVVWSGCETSAGCRATASDGVKEYLRRSASGVSELTAGEAEALGFGRAPTLRLSETVERSTGNWTVTWLTSLQVIRAREAALLARLVLTAIAAAIAVAGVGLVILRQQRKAVALEGHLTLAQALASARETSEAIVESAPVGVLGVSQEGRVVLANGFLTERIGPIQLGAPLSQAFSGDGITWLKEVEPFLLAELNQTGEKGHRSEVRVLDLKAHQLHVRIVPVRNPGLGIRVFALVEDQSELRSLENQLVRAEKLITVGVLSAGIAHEIGSPLAVIRGRAEQVLRDVGAGPRGEDLRVVIKHIDNISSTIRQLLDFSRRQPIVRRAVPLQSAVERARQLLQWKLVARRLRLVVALDDDLPALAADPDQLQQVLVNLLLNACDASEPDTEVILSGRKTDQGGVRLEVIDHGCGIATEHMHAVFDPFFTTKKRGEGTGLGLPIVASIVRNHGGEINLASTHHKGTTVTVLWPGIAPGGAEHG